MCKITTVSVRTFPSPQKETMYEISGVVKLLENRLVLPGAEEGGRDSCFLMDINGYRISVLQDEKVLEICCTTLCI